MPRQDVSLLLPRYDFEGIRDRIRMLAILGIFAHPVYFVTWEYIFPQTYENPWIRALYIVMIVIWLFLDNLIKENNLIFRIFTYIFLTLGLPFYFFYMYLNNFGSTVWLGSLICGMLYLTLMVEIISLIIITFAGFSLAFIIILIEGIKIHNEYLIYEHIPVILFALLGGIAFKYQELFTIQRNQDEAMALAGSIAHELRTPIMGMQLELASLSEPETHDVLSQEDRQALALLQQHQKKSSHIVNSLLQNVQRGDIDRSGFRQENIGPIVAQVIDHYPFFPNQRQLVHWDDDQDFVFYGDSFLTSHVLMNLINNGLRSIAAAEKGTLHIRLETHNAHNILSVCDTGIGLSPKEHRRIFDRFYSTTPGGAGLGLTFCQRVMRSFGGRIDVRSEVGTYTDFRLIFPKPQQ